MRTKTLAQPVSAPRRRRRCHLRPHRHETHFWPDPNYSDMPVDIASRVASGLSVADGHVALAGKGQTDRLFQVAEFSRRSARPVVKGHRPFLRFRRAGLVSLRADRIGTDRFLLPPTLRWRPWPGVGAPEHSRQDSQRCDLDTFARIVLPTINAPFIC